MKLKTFLDELSKTKNMSWHKTESGSIRTRHKEYCPCPIRVVDFVRSKKWSINTLISAKNLELEIGVEAEICDAADSRNKYNKLRQSMLRRLGLPLDK